jgi:hypothetical protein
MSLLQSILNAKTELGCRVAAAAYSFTDPPEESNGFSHPAVVQTGVRITMNAEEPLILHLADFPA